MGNLNIQSMNDRTPRTNMQKLHKVSKIAIAHHLANLVKNGRSKVLSPADSGFSLLESLVAVAVVGILIAAITPMVALTTSARINSRRVDQATQAARSYIDAVRGGVIDTTNFPNNLVQSNAVASSTNAQAQYTFESIVAPTLTTFPISTTACQNIANNVPSGTVQGICVSPTGNAYSSANPQNFYSDPQNFFIQPMRSGPLNTVTTASTDLKNQGFWLAVRVYRADALFSGLTLLTGTETACSRQSSFGNPLPRNCPLVTMRSQILPTVNASNLDNIRTGTGSN